MHEAGASEDKSRKAAEALAACDSRFSTIDLKPAAVDARSEDVEGSIRLLRWQVAALHAVAVQTLRPVFRVPAKVGAPPAG